MCRTFLFGFAVYVNHHLPAPLAPNSEAPVGSFLEFFVPTLYP